MKWLAAYLYYSNENREKFLVKAVYPFIQQVQQKKWASEYFFIRYGERGPHIRLRFKGEEKVLEEMLKPALIEHFEAYFKEYPSNREEPNYPSDYPNNQKWLPNNSIYFEDYEPETARYGGNMGILIAEQQFQASSKVVLELLSKNEDWDYSNVLGTAIQLHLAFVHSLGMNLQEAKYFFHYIAMAWLSRSYHIPQNSNKETRQEMRASTINAFTQSFEEQKETLLPFFEFFWTTLEEKTIFEDEWMNIWLSDIKEIGEQLQATQKKNLLVFTPHFQVNFDLPIKRKQQLLWSIYEPFIHMTNNRLGVMNREESFLGWILKEGLQ